MDSKCKAKLLNCRSFAEAKPILETLKLSTSGEELARTAYQIRETQPSVAEHFLRTVIREADDVTDALKKTDTNKKDGISETDDNTDNQSTSTTGLEKIGSEAPAPEGAPAQPDQKDQMGVVINEMGGMPPMNGQPPMGAPPAVAENGLPPAGGAAPPPPPMPPVAPPMPAPQQMMRYTISETLKIINPQLKQIAEAVMALDKKVQETTIQSVKSLNLGDAMLPRKPQLIRETTGNPETDLSHSRSNIKQMNDALKEGYIK